MIDAATARIRIKQASRKLSFLPLLLTRITLGGLFLSTGWGKVHDLAKVTGFFTKLGIPAPAFNAHLVAWSELLCGGLLLIGLASRLASVPLIVTMIVALATAKRPEIHGLVDLFGQVELTYLVMLITIFCLGPGAASIDGLVAGMLDRRKADRGRPRAEPVEPAYVW